MAAYLCSSAGTAGVHQAVSAPASGKRTWTRRMAFSCRCGAPQRGHRGRERQVAATDWGVTPM